MPGGQTPAGGQKYLVVSSDDFGMCHSVNRGTVRAMREGVVSSTNLMVPCSWFPEAAVLARRHALPVGVHLCLTSEWDRYRWRPLTRATRLSDASGHFFESYDALGAQASLEELEPELELELAAQVSTALAAVGELTHLNNHMLSAFPFDGVRGLVQRVSERLARKYALPLTGEVTPEGLVHFRAEHCCSGVPHAVTWERLASFSEPGVYHLIGHAAEPAEELDALCSPENPARAWANEYRVRDQELFTDVRTRARLVELGFQLIGIKELTRLQSAA